VVGFHVSSSKYEVQGFVFLGCFQFTQKKAEPKKERKEENKGKLI